MKVALADVLWEAANKRLYPGNAPQKLLEGYASCFAVTDAIWAQSGTDRMAAEEAAMRFLTDLGCDCGQYQFRDIPEGVRRQGVRYMWLLLAMLVAEDEGIEV